jgi:hypothetical protein
MFVVYLFLFLFVVSPALGANGKQDILRVVPGMSSADILKINETCKILNQSRKTEKLWSSRENQNELECIGPDGIVRIQLTQYSGVPKAHSIIYYFKSNLNYFEIQASISNQYGVNGPNSTVPAGPMTIYMWKLKGTAGTASGIDLFLAASTKGSDYVLRLVDEDLMISTSTQTRSTTFLTQDN